MGSTPSKNEEQNVADVPEGPVLDFIIQQMPSDLLVHLVSTFLTPSTIDAFVTTATRHLQLKTRLWTNCKCLYLPTKLPTTLASTTVRALVHKYWYVGS